MIHIRVNYMVLLFSSNRTTRRANYGQRDSNPYREPSVEPSSTTMTSNKSICQAFNVRREESGLYTKY